MRIAERIQKKAHRAYAEATWVVMGIVDAIRSKRTKPYIEPIFDNPIQAAVHFSNYHLGYNERQIKEKIYHAAMRGRNSADPLTRAISDGYIRSRRQVAESI